MAKAAISYRGIVRPIDQSVVEAAAEREGQVRFRVQPTLLRLSGNYLAWRGVSWMVDCETVAEAIAIRQALEAFFSALQRHGAAAIEKALTPQGPSA